MRAGTPSTEDPNRASGRLLPVEVKPATRSISAAPGCRSSPGSCRSPRRYTHPPPPLQTSWPERRCRPSSIRLISRSKPISSPGCGSPLGRCHRNRNRVAGVRRLPRPPHHPDLSRGASGDPHPDRPVVAGRGDEKAEGCRRLVRPEVKLNAIGVDVVGLVVETERGSAIGTHTKLGLPHVHRDIDRVGVPVDRGDRRELLGPRVRLVAPTVLVLVIEREWRRRVEGVQRAVEHRGIRDAQREAGGRRPTLVIDQRTRRWRASSGGGREATPALPPRSHPSPRSSAHGGRRPRRSPLRSRRRRPATNEPGLVPTPPPPRKPGALRDPARAAAASESVPSSPACRARSLSRAPPHDRGAERACRPTYCRRGPEASPLRPG